MKRSILFFLSLWSFLLASAEVATVQPSIMVIPFVPEGGDIRSTLDLSNDKRQVIAQINGAFADKGFQTKDFYSNFKSVSQNSVFEDNSQTDLKTKVIESSGADIFVEADINVNYNNSGNSVRIVLKACDAATNKALASKIGDSGKFYTNDIGKLGAKAAQNALEGFLGTMQQSFRDVMNHGRSIVVNITFNNDSDYTTKSEVGADGDELRDLIEEWMERNAHKNNYHIQGTSEYKMIFDDVRIPLKDPKTGNNYNINKFSRKLVAYFRQLGMNADRTINGNTLYIQIQ